MADPLKIPAAPPAAPPERLSPFAAAIAQAEKERPVDAFDVAGFFGLGDRPIPRVGIRIPTQGEQDRALVAAHAYVDELARGNEAARTDPEILQNAKLAAIAVEFSREVVESSPGVFTPTGYPAFPSAKWAIGKLSTEQIGVLVNLANETRAKRAPSPVELDDVTVEAYLSVCSTSPAPEYDLVGLTREYVVQLVIIGAAKLAAARAAIEGQAARIAELEARVEVVAAPPSSAA